MKAILYLSKATETFDREALKALEVKSEQNNAALGLSGYLYFDGDKFLQYLEGEEEKLIPLLKTIKSDPRHEFLCQTEEEILDKRFPEWHMKNIQSIVMELSLVEKTIIQTLSIFIDKGYDLDRSISRDLFKLMDHLRTVTL